MERKSKGKKKDKSCSPKAEDTRRFDLELLDGLIKEFFEKVKKKGLNPRAQDVIKAIQLKQQLIQSGDGEKVYWGMIQELREEGIGKNITCATCPASAICVSRHKQEKEKTEETDHDR